MPSPYKLKKDPLDEDRVKKIVKNLIEDAKSDRDLAKESYDFFKAKVENENEDVSKVQMTQCLRLMQTSGDRITALLKMVKGVTAGQPAKASLTDSKTPFLGRKI